MANSPVSKIASSSASSVLNDSNQRLLIKFPANLDAFPRYIGFKINKQIVDGKPSLEYGKYATGKGPIESLQVGVKSASDTFDYLSSIADMEVREETKAYIYMPLPANIAADHTANWSSAAFSPLDLALSEWAAHGKDWGVLYGTLASRLTMSGVSLLSRVGVSKAGGSPGTAAAAGGAILKAAKQAVNPYHHLMYSGPNFRTFTFEWVLSPSNAAEARDIAALVFIFKKYMHTASSATNDMFFTFPGYVDVKFYDDNEDILNSLMPLERCAITRVSVQHERKFHSDGFPIATRLSIDLMESVLLTQDNFKDEDIDKIYGDILPVDLPPFEKGLS